MSFFAARSKRAQFLPLPILGYLVSKEKSVSLFVCLILLSAFLTSQRGISETKKKVLDIEMKGNLSRNSWGLRPLVWGYLKPHEIVINGQIFKLKNKIFQDETTRQFKTNGPEKETPVVGSVAQPSEGEESPPNNGPRLPGPLVWTSIWSESQLARCNREPKVRDLLFLALTMVTDIERIEIEAHPDLVECSRKVRSELLLLDFIIAEGHPVKKKS